MTKPDDTSTASPNPSDARSDASDPRSTEVRFGDLVLVEALGTVYYGIVLIRRRTSAIVFLGNGLEAIEDLDKITPVSMHPGSPCHANFDEILKFSSIDIASRGSGGSADNASSANDAGNTSGCPTGSGSTSLSGSSGPSRSSTDDAPPAPPNAS